MFDVQFAVDPGFVYGSAEVHLEGILGSRSKPHAAVFQPVVGKFHLIAVNDFLFENAVVVANGKAGSNVAAAG